MVKVSPSVLAADLSDLKNEVLAVDAAGADMIHLDVMDGRFVTNITFGIPVIACLRRHTSAVFDVHLMIEEPERYIERFIDAGADILTFHVEACADPRSALELIRARGCRAAISVKPNTPVSDIYPYLDVCDMVLVMTVEPGYGGQALIPECLDKVRELKAEITSRGLDTLIQVDGGINFATAPEAVRAGADILVAGSAVFGAENPAEAISTLKNIK